MDTITPDDLLGRLIEAERRGRQHYTVYVNPDSSYVQDAIKDLQQGLLLPDANKISQYFRRGWAKEKHHLAYQKMHKQHPELRLLLKTRAILQDTLNELTETIDRIEKEHPDA